MNNGLPLFTKLWLYIIIMNKRKRYLIFSSLYDPKKNNLYKQGERFMINGLNTKLMVIANMMEKNIEKANIISMKGDVSSQEIIESDMEKYISDKMWRMLNKRRNVYYLDMVIFDDELYFVIFDEYLFIKCENSSFDIDGILDERIYNVFRDIVLNAKSKCTNKDIM